MTSTRLYQTVGIVFLVVTMATIWVHTTVTRTYISDTKSIASPPYLKPVPTNIDTGLPNDNADLGNPGSPNELYTSAELKLKTPDRSMLYNISLAGDIDRLLWNLDENIGAKVRGVDHSLYRVGVCYITYMYSICRQYAHIGSLNGR